MAETYPKGFYVYQLVDPRTGLPFYVGKGQRDRAWHHQRDVEAGRPGKNERKVQRIREILQSGADVEVTIVAEYELESDALDHEYRLVDADPTLTNIAPGGGGRVTSPELLARIQAKRAERLRVLREKEQIEREKRRVEAEARRLAERKKQLLSIPGAERHAGSIEGWLEEQAAQGAFRRTTMPQRGPQPLQKRNPLKQSKSSKEANKQQAPSPFHDGTIRVSRCGGIYGRGNAKSGRRTGT